MGCGLRRRGSRWVRAVFAGTGHDPSDLVYNGASPTIPVRQREEDGTDKGQTQKQTNTNTTNTNTDRWSVPRTDVAVTLLFALYLIFDEVSYLWEFYVLEP